MFQEEFHPLQSSSIYVTDDLSDNLYYNPMASIQTSTDTAASTPFINYNDVSQQLISYQFSGSNVISNAEDPMFSPSSSCSNSSPFMISPHGHTLTPYSDVQVITPPLSASSDGGSYYGWSMDNGEPGVNNLGHSRMDSFDSGDEGIVTNALEVDYSNTYFPYISTFTPINHLNNNSTDDTLTTNPASSVAIAAAAAAVAAAVAASATTSISSPYSSPIISTPTQSPIMTGLEEENCTKWVKLSRMTISRVDKIKTLAKDKGISVETVDSVLELYSSKAACNSGPTRRKSSSRLGDDVYIKITMSGGLTNSDSDHDEHNKVTNSKKPTAKHRSSKRRSENYVKRPLNSFMLYRRSQTQSAMAYAVSSDLKLNHQNISQIIGLMWQTESKDVKDEFAAIAGQEKELHKALHPDYKFCPQKKRKSTC